MFCLSYLPSNDRMIMNDGLRITERNLNYYEIYFAEWELNQKNSVYEAKVLTTITVNEHTKHFPSDHSSQAVFNPHF
jgi:hypothetical protein